VKNIKTAHESKTYHHGNLRDALIVAAAELIQDSGSVDFALTDAARKAGVSNAAPYRHFKDKEELLYCVSELGFLGLNNQSKAIQSQFQMGSIDAIIALGKGYMSYVTARPAFFDLMWGERGFKVLEDMDEMHSKLRINGFWTLVNQVEVWCEEEQIAEADPMDLSMKLWAMAIGLSHLTINRQLELFAENVDPFELLSTSTQSFLRGVKETQGKR
jgi:AcrR family transcriptional regulator